MPNDTEHATHDEVAETPAFPPGTHFSQQLVLAIERVAQTPAETLALLLLLMRPNSPKVSDEVRGHAVRRWLEAAAGESELSPFEWHLAAERAGKRWGTGEAISILPHGLLGAYVRHVTADPVSAEWAALAGKMRRAGVKPETIYQVAKLSPRSRNVLLGWLRSERMPAVCRLDPKAVGYLVRFCTSNAVAPRPAYAAVPQWTQLRAALAQKGATEMLLTKLDAVAPESTARILALLPYMAQKRAGIVLSMTDVNWLQKHANA